MTAQTHLIPTQDADVPFLGLGFCLRVQPKPCVLFSTLQYIGQLCLGSLLQTVQHSADESELPSMGLEAATIPVKAGNFSTGEATPDGSQQSACNVCCALHIRKATGCVLACRSCLRS